MRPNNHTLAFVLFLRTHILCLWWVLKLNWWRVFATSSRFFYLLKRRHTHSTTKTSPFEALTGRKMNTGKPKDPIPKLVHNHIAEKNARGRKTYADIKRRIKLSLLCLSEKVLIRQKKQNKLSSPYNPKDFTVIKENGSVVTSPGTPLSSSE